MKNKGINDSIKMFKDVLNFSKVISIIYIIYIALGTFLRLGLVYHSSEFKYLGMMFLVLALNTAKVIGCFVLIKLIEASMKFFDDIINNKMFSEVVIKRLDEMVKLSTIYYIIWAIATLSLQIPILSLAFVIYVSKEIFVYGNKLEEEVNLTI